MRKSLPIAVIFLLLGMIPAWVALSYGLEARAFLSRAVATSGEITRYQWFAGAAGRDTDKAFTPILRFRDQSGAVVEAPANLLMANDAEKLGDEVTVFFDPADTSQVRIDSFLSLYAATTVFAVPSLVLILFGLYRLPVGARGRGGG
jgi:hypothetical protein